MVETDRVEPGTGALEGCGGAGEFKRNCDIFESGSSSK